jgi:hypothetical protein
MALRGKVNANHVPVNNFELAVSGETQTFWFTEISGIEFEIQAVDLPDRTKASGGNPLPQEFTAKMLMHHDAERKVLNEWLEAAIEPVTATYKKTATLTHKTIAGANNAKYTITGLWIMKRKLPDLDRANEGEAAVIEWTFSADLISEFVAPAS